MANSEKKENQGKNTEKNNEDLQALSKEVAKRISKVKPAARRQSILRRINPLIVLVVLLGIAFVVFSLWNGGGEDTKQLSLNEVVQNLRDNRYSQVLVQNDEKVVAVEKHYYVLDESIDAESFEFGDEVQVKDELEEITFEELLEKLEDTSAIDTIREALGQKSGGITELVVADEFLLAITADEDANYLIRDTDKKNFKDALEEEGSSEGALGIPVRELSVFSRGITAESLEERADTDELSGVTILEDDGLTLVSRSEDAIKTYEVAWTFNYVSFVTELLEEYELPVDADNYEIVSVNVPAGIAFDDILTILIIIGFVVLAVVIFRSAQASGMGIMQFGQSKARMFFGQKPDVTFEDVAGIDEAKEELSEVVDFLKNPGKFRKMGARIPKGILMFGSPGTGKTLLARAIAGEAGVPFFHTSGSEFEEMLVGAGASRVRDLFAKAKKAAPALIFIDEIDAVARKRGTRIQSGSTEQTLNQILVEMDGFEKNVNVIVIAATNRPDVLDNAILRPGRFDRQIRIEEPDREGRMQILGIHSKGKPLADEVDLEKIAARTVGFTGADLENIMNEAAIIAAKREGTEITMQDIDDAVSKVVLGPAKKSRKRTEKEMQLVAYHEAGHALVAKLTEGAVPVDKISIVSRGQSGGVTMFTPEKDENIISRSRLLADIKVSLGGRAAEEVALDDISTGASSDIQKATRVAKNMIQRFGMSKDLGMVQYGNNMDSEHLGYAYGDSRNFSEETASKIDTEVRDVIGGLYTDAVKLLKDNRYMLDKVAKKLLEVEVLDKEEFEKMFEEDAKG